MRTDNMYNISGKTIGLEVEKNIESEVCPMVR